MLQGKLIAVEGPDGVGKSTQVRMLREKYTDAIFTREPGGTPYAEKIRQVIFEGKEASVETLFMLFWAARAEHIDKLIIPALESGKIVITDRFDLSTFAYQLRGQFDTKELDSLFWMFRKRFVLDKIGAKNVHYVYLDMDISNSIERLNKRDGEVTYFDTFGYDFHQRVRDGGHEFMKTARHGLSFGEQNVHMIDAGFEPGIVHIDIVATIENILTT